MQLIREGLNRNVFPRDSIFGGEYGPQPPPLRSCATTWVGSKVN